MAVSSDPGAPEIAGRKRIVIIDPSVAGAKQPYHFAEKMGLQDAAKHLERCAAATRRLASAVIDETLDDLRSRGYRIAGCAMLLASGRSLPALADILASHALIHTAEGEFFRRIVSEAFEHAGVRVTGFRERELDERARKAFGDAAPRILERISELRSVVGSPWTKDEKTVTLAALMLLSGKLG